MAQVVALRRRFPHLGPRKLLAVRRREGDAGDWPSASTIGAIMAREGLVEKKRHRRPALDAPRRDIAVDAANEEWAVDYKGWFRTLDQARIDPLTITNRHNA